MNDSIASRRLICIRPSGASVILTATIGKPYSVPQGCRCPVSIDPTYTQLADIMGVDSWQALHLAMKLVAELLKGEVREGSKLYWPNEGTDVANYECEYDLDEE